MAKKRASKKKQKGDSDSQLYAFLATFFTIIGFIIFLVSKRKDKYVEFYAKQGLVLFIGYLIAIAFGWIPVIGWIYWIFLIAIWMMAWLNALSGEKKDTWLIGDMAKKIKL